MAIVLPRPRLGVEVPTLVALGRTASDLVRPRVALAPRTVRLSIAARREAYSAETLLAIGFGLTLPAMLLETSPFAAGLAALAVALGVFACHATAVGRSRSLVRGFLPALVVAAALLVQIARTVADGWEGVCLDPNAAACLNAGQHVLAILPFGLAGLYVLVSVVLVSHVLISATRG